MKSLDKAIKEVRDTFRNESIGYECPIKEVEANRAGLIKTQ